MHFLELPIRNGTSSGGSPLDNSQRSISQTNFITEEDARSDVTDLTMCGDRKSSSASCAMETDASNK